AEDGGYDGAWVFDHFKPLYGDPGGPCLEGWTLLAALAATTKRIRLGALVTGVTYRHPSVLTAEAITVDHVSNGRLEFGIGAAWFADEHHQLGIDFPSNAERAHRLEEALNVYERLCAAEETTFEGRYYTLSGARMRPAPVQQPHPPIWIGAHRPQLMLPIVGRHADVWHTFAKPGPDYEKKWSIVAEHAALAGRDPKDIHRSLPLDLSQGWDDVKRAVEAAEEAGVAYMTAGWPGEGQAHLDHFTEKLMPKLR
ncbi:MAG: LLM class flavin-dependent oxidoreductase, partial [Actinobacteria bacterium]|nr:LLM class flavin-dependent oxidoreductase [Actinomycetota bacterium]